MEYTIVEGWAKSIFENDVQKMLNNGWELNGATVIHCYDYIDEDDGRKRVERKYYQPMIKRDRK